MMLNERLRTSVKVRGGSHAGGFEINGDDDVGAEERDAFHWNRGSEKSVHQGAVFKLNRHEETGIGAGAAQRRGQRAAGVINGDAGVDVGGGDGQGSYEVFEIFCGREAGEIFFEALIGGEAEPGRGPAAEIGEAGVRADALHFFERRAGTIGGADQRADAGAGDSVNVNALVAQNPQHADVRDAAGEAAGQSQADFGAREVWRFAAAAVGGTRFLSSSQRRITLEMTGSGMRSGQFRC